ncbi:MAG: Tautomerase enzyme [Streptosporangiales bacterium]|nr:Tautomerase enzyme [Streptosporangiales bacterium]
MPMLDAYIPEGALSAEAERNLLTELTTILLTWEGADPRNAAARSIAWVFLHRPTAVLVGGEATGEPRYKIVATVPEGQLDDERRGGMVAAVTDAVLKAEGATRKRDALRVWVFTQEVPDGSWGAGGRIQRLADIAGFVLGDEAAGEAHARAQLSAARS